MSKIFKPKVTYIFDAYGKKVPLEKKSQFIEHFLRTASRVPPIKTNNSNEPKKPS